MFKTHYDTLGVNPSASQGECSSAFEDAVRAILDGDSIGSFKVRSTMWQGQYLDKIEELTKAIRVLCHHDRKDAYDKELRRLGIVCDLCEGTGKVLDREWGTRGIPCLACGGTGKTRDFGCNNEKKEAPGA